MAIVAVVKDEARGFFYAPGTTEAIMAGGNWQPMLQASQLRLFHVGDEHLAASEEDDTLYRLRLDSLEHVTATEFAPRGGSSVVTDAAGNVYVAFTTLADGRLVWWRFRSDRQAWHSEVRIRKPCLSGPVVRSFRCRQWLRDGSTRSFALECMLQELREQDLLGS